MATMLYFPDSLGWIVANQYELTRRVFKEVLKMAQTPPVSNLVAKTSERDLFIRLKNGAETFGKSCDNPDGLLGEALEYVVMDEAPRIDKDIWDSYIFPSLATTEGWAVMIGTPYGKNWYYDLFLRGQKKDPLVKSWRFPSWVNPYLPKEEVKLAKRTIPKRSFDQNWRAEFVSGGGEVFQGLADIQDDKLTLSNEPTKNGRYVMGIDFGQKVSFTVIIILNQHGQLVHIERFKDMLYDRQLDRMVTLAKQWNNAKVVVDSTGGGGFLPTFLLKAGVKVEGFNFSGTSKPKLIDGLAAAIERHEISVPLWDSDVNLMTLRHELEIFESRVTPAGNLQYSAPPGYHDDCPDALALAVYGLMLTTFKEIPSNVWNILPVDEGIGADLSEQEAFSRDMRRRYG